jgi:prevent-host-death family protein
MMNTHVRPIRDLRNNYPELADIIKHRDHVIITNNGESEYVLISFEELKNTKNFCTTDTLKKN